MIDKLGAPAASSSAPARPAEDPARVRDAASQFEALMLGQLLKTMRSGGEGGWLGTGEDEAGASMLEIAEEHLARVLASQGGLGLASLVVKGLEKPKP